jgi:hypothetical protein
MCQETGKKIRESKSVQKSAKLVHITFKVRDLQLHIFQYNFLYFSFLNFCTNDDERSLGFLQEVESLQQIPISGKHLFNKKVMVLHNGGFCNGCITKRFLLNSTNVSYNDDLVSTLLHDKRLN